ncbi:MAG: hypothetical protein A2201_12490 [Alicyclobacillus sp. RIFOXYA1_FULL_53_8]|nr:MAG: hypothetical protein A2201_12490 [Alicyclobacillus sp. RIFOXYA1_FULL_53_8]
MQRAKGIKNRKSQPPQTARSNKRAGGMKKLQSPAKTASTPATGNVATAGLAFRPRTPADDTYILQLTEEQLGTIHQSAFGESFPREQFWGYIQSGAPTVVVESKGKRIGYYSYLLGPDGKMHISAMVIEPQYQSTGFGTEIMSRLETEAASNGVHTLEVFVQSNNAKSLAFTKKLGFVEAFRLEPNTICFQKLVHRPMAQGAATAALPPDNPYWFY